MSSSLWSNMPINGSGIFSSQPETSVFEFTNTINFCARTAKICEENSNHLYTNQASTNFSRQSVIFRGTPVMTYREDEGSMVHDYVSTLYGVIEKSKENQLKTQSERDAFFRRHFTIFGMSMKTYDIFPSNSRIYDGNRSQVQYDAMSDIFALPYSIYKCDVLNTSKDVIYQGQRLYFTLPDPNGPPITVNFEGGVSAFLPELVRIDDGQYEIQAMNIHEQFIKVRTYGTMSEPDKKNSHFKLTKQLDDAIQKIVNAAEKISTQPAPGPRGSSGGNGGRSVSPSLESSPRLLGGKKQEFMVEDESQEAGSSGSSSAGSNGDLQPAAGNGPGVPQAGGGPGQFDYSDFKNTVTDTIANLNVPIVKELYTPRVYVEVISAKCAPGDTFTGFVSVTNQ